MKHPRLSIVIPAYQEALRIEPALEELATYLKTNHLDEAEVLLVVADSPDGTLALAQAKAALFKHFRIVASGPKQGKGHQIQIGMIAATGSYKLFMDADLATPLIHIREVLEAMSRNADVIIAVRNLEVIHSGERKWISSLGNRLVQAVLLPGIIDTQCGFKAFRADVAEELFRRQTIVGWGFDLEILAIARMRGYTIETISVDDWADKPHGSFDLGVTSAALGTLAELARIMWRRWSGQYKHKTFTSEPGIHETSQ